MLTMCCTEIEQIDIYIDPAAENILLPFVANLAGTWKITVEFAGNMRQANSDLEVGDPLLVPNAFNENGVHILRIYDPNNELFNDKCYCVKTMKTIFMTATTVSPFSSGSFQIDGADAVEEIVGPDTFWTYQNNALKNAMTIIVAVEGAVWEQGVALDEYEYVIADGKIRFHQDMTGVDITILYFKF